MATPFPGMDPFIELQEWPDFHATYMTVLRELLTPQIRPRYVARVERRVYLEQPFDKPDQAIPDIAVIERQTSGSQTAHAGESSATVAPVECLLPEREEHREYYLVLRGRISNKIVTLIELLSPTNKRRNSEGRRLYLQKREEVLGSYTNLIELDLLRSGERLPMRSALPPADYYAVVRRAWRGLRADVYAWSLRNPLPAIPVPLQEDEPEPTLELQTALEITYERAAYEDTLDYSQPLEPSPPAEDAVWIREVTGSAR